MPLAAHPRTPAKPPRFRLKGRPKKPPRARPDHCLNCGRPTDGNFCAHCGQENKDHTVALQPLLHDLLAEVVSWDSKLLRTMVPLVVRPGFLTNEYNAGRRVPYLSALKLYLTLSVLFFLGMTWKDPLAGSVRVGGTPLGTHKMTVFGGKPQPLPHTEAEYEARQKRLPPADQDPAPARQIVRRVIRAGQNPQTFLKALLGDIPKMMFFLLPLFAVLLKLLYLRTRRLYVEHLVFLLHVHAFGFLALAPLLLPHTDWLTVLVCLVIPTYVFAALRVVYKQGWLKTGIKFSLLGLGYVFLLSLCIAGTALVALWLL